VSDKVEVAPGVKVLRAAEERFWTARDAHELIRGWAFARMVSPHALLVAVIQRLLASTPPNVVLPPIIGGDASLNLFAALVGPSSAGKDRALDVAAGALQIEGGTLYADALIGTGEGLVDTFAHWDQKNRRTVIDNDAALIRVSEVDTWAAVADRRGATLQGVLRSGFMGQTLGFGYRSSRTTLPPHSYRLCLVVGVQPGHAEVLLGPEAITGGTAGRFLWVSSQSTELSRYWSEPPERLAVRLPDFPDARVEVAVCATAEEAVRELAYQITTGTEEVDPIDGYSLLIREKLAFGLSLLDGRAEVGEEDWRLAGHVLALSKATRDHTLRILAEKMQERATTRVVIENRAEDAARRRGRVWVNCEKRVTEILRAARVEPDSSWGDWRPYSEFSKNLSGAQRAVLDDVLEDMLERAALESKNASPTASTNFVLYRLLT